MLYVSAQPPPLIWVYKCASCRWFQSPNRCAIVSENGSPDPGVIAPESWCLLWANRDDDDPFAWFPRRAAGRRDPWVPAGFTANGKSFPLTYVATNSNDLRIGLGGKPISDATTMLFMFAGRDYYDFWMDGVTANLDMIWVDSDGRVVHIVKNAPTCAPGTCSVYHPVAPANYMIEAKAGFVDANGIVIGTVVSFF